MTLLEPIATITAAAAALPVVLLLYLLKLRRRPLRVSSTLFWQTAVHDLQANVPFRWLRPSWLLLLHIAVLGLLVGALGRPAITPTDEPSRRVVILFDRSASMGAADGPEGRTRLDAAKDAARALVGRSLDSAGTSLALATFAAESRVDIGFSTDRTALQDAIGSITQTDQPADLAGALKLVEALLAANQDESALAGAATVVLVSDGSFEDAPLALGGARLSFLRVGPAVIPPDGPDNIGIVALAARRDYDDPATVRLFVRIQNASRAPRDVPLSLALGDTVLTRRAIAVPGASEPPAAATPENSAGVSAGEASTTFELKSPAGGVATVTIERPDLLSCDNTASILLPAARRPRIVLVTPDAGTPPTSPQPEPGPSDQISAETLLADAASELDSASFTRLERAQYETIAESGRPAAGDLYIFDRVRPSVLPAAPSLSFGAPAPITGLEFAPGTSGGPGTFVLSWLRTHPALRDVAMDSVFINGPMRITRSRAPGLSPPQIIDLATGNAGPLIVQVQDGPFRRIVVGFDVSRSNWPLQVGFPLFLAAAADYLTMRAEEFAGKAFTTAQPVEILPPDRVDRFELRGPVTIPVAVPPPTPGRLAGDTIPVPVGRLERAGVYHVVPPGPDPFVVANLCNSVETSLATREAVEVGGRSVAAAAAAGVSREVWPWFVLGAGALLLIEWFIYARRMRI